MKNILKGGYMKKVFFCFLVFFIGLWLFSEGNVVKIKELLENSNQFMDEVVTVEGFVTQYVEATAKTTSFFYLKDDWGAIIKVRTTKEAPIVGNRYRISGPLSYDSILNEPYISEEVRISLSEAPSPVEAPKFNILYLFIFAIIIIALIFLFLVFWLFRKKRAYLEVPIELKAEISATPKPEEVVEGKTIKMHRPPEGTLKILPGYFEVKSGDENVKEIRFYKLKEQEYPEITFGRAEGAPYTHIQLKPLTVSSRQAKLTMKDGKYLLQNFAGPQSNPTRINGREMKQDEVVELKDNDKIDMGEVSFVFYLPL